MFLRTGWVVGNAGLRDALLILCIANGITFLTSLSLSAISTNTKVGGGGAYFLISRSLGLEIGGSIGVPLYLAQAVSVAFYVIGFTESLNFLLPGLNTQWVATGVCCALFVIAWVGADLAIKTQFAILLCLLLSLVSFFAGVAPESHLTVNLSPGYSEGHNFWTVFAIFFPAVTGVMSGVSMSGDLKDPARSIPRGTLAAVVATFVIYAAQMIWLGRNAARPDLIGNTLIMRDLAAVPMLIFVGLWAATLSSALASFVAAPRTLQALGRDRVVPALFARGYGRLAEPRIALVMTFVIAECAILKGDLDLIAPVISMFFLVTYGMVNLVAGLERWVANPSYRPTFRVHWFLSMLGAIGCAVVMFLLSPIATVVAVVLTAGIYGLLTRRRYKTAWGDVRSGFWFAVTRLGVLQLSRLRPHIRNWRPILLVLVGNPKSRKPLLQLARGIEAGRGLLFLSQVVSGDWQKLVSRQAGLQASLEEFIRENRLSAVAKTVLAEDFEHGVSTLLQVAGLGAVQPNTVLLGWSDDAVKQRIFSRTIHRILELQRNLLVLSEAKVPADQLEPVIDVWWRARENGSLMTTLAHLMQANPEWRDTTLRVIRIIRDEAGIAEAEIGLGNLLKEARLTAEVKIVVSQEPPLDVIARTSARSAVCFLGMAIRALEEKDNPLDTFIPVVEQVQGSLILTKSWHDLEL